MVLLSSLPTNACQKKKKTHNVSVLILRILKLTVLNANLRKMKGQEVVILSMDASGWKRYCENKDASQGAQLDSPQLA